MVLEVARTVSCKNIQRATVHEKSSFRRIAFTATFVLLYAIVLPYVWNTMGEPLRRAKAEADALDHQKLHDELESFDEVTLTWEDDAATVDTGMAEDEEDDEEEWWDGEEVEEEEEGEEAAGEEDEAMEGTEGNETEKFTRPLPSPFLPDAGAVAAMFALVVSHALFYLLRHWLVSFEVGAMFKPADRIKPGFYVHIVPFAYRGKPAVVPIELNKRSGNLEFEFQRQKFVIVGPSSRKEFESAAEPVQIMKGDESMMEPAEVARLRKEAEEVAVACGYVLPFSAPVNNSVRSYVESKGVVSDAELEDLKDRFGTNTLRMESATLLQLLQAQLLSPLAMFQLFSASLWLMDEYWQQTLFTIFTIILMESTTAMQRWRTMKILKGLAPKPVQVPVYRKRKWQLILSDELLPGDLICLNSSKGTKSGSANSAPTAANDVIPCDCLLLHGSAVVNEATLTGESVPQMKDAITAASNADLPLDMNGRDRVHCMFSGTTLVSASRIEKESGSNVMVAEAPEGGCICVVLRTGFGSSQGELMQMIEFSTATVTADAKETGLALLILFLFALCSAGYVFKKGLEKGDRTTHELLLKCIIIITSVVPQTLPVQMAAAVNFALMALMREGIFCTEPYRMPFAGKVTHCLFDKTGTLTSDELVPVGVINASDRDTSHPAHDQLLPVIKASADSSMVLAACHSLIAIPKKKKADKDKKTTPSVEEELLGDPIEIAAMKGVQWRFDPKSQCARPGDFSVLEAAIHAVDAQIATLPANAGKPLDALRERKATLAASLKKARDEAQKCAVQEIRILHRFHFASKLQRMCVVCKVRRRGSNSFEETPTCLVKGSPEAVGALLVDSERPEWYDSTYRHLAERGMRVLALAFKRFKDKVDVTKLPRESAESELSFAGFIAFECKTRADSPIVIQSLRDAAHSVAMLTGDAPLTALHVAKETNIIGGRAVDPLMLSVKADGREVEWVSAIGDESKAVHVPFNAQIEGCGIADLHKQYDLITTEKALDAAELLSNGRLWSEVEHIKVFARMSPQGKAKVIRKIQDDQVTNSKRFVLMCGDGGNDVGALKQADVGLALLSGYGSANTDQSGAEPADGKGGETDAEKALNDQREMLRTKARKAMKEKKKELALIKKKVTAKQKVMLEKELQRRAEAGLPSGVSGHFQAVKKVSMDMREELRKEQAILERKYNVFLKPSKGKSHSKKDPTELALESLGDDPNMLPVVRPGDASVAAPFTSRTPSVSSVVHMIRQGRCTLLSALQQQQIMMLECTISAYCLAALSLEGARSSERQMIASSWLVMTAVGAFSYASPIDRMHPVRPLRSLFHPAIFLSIVGQAAIHLFCIVQAVSMATEAMGPEKLQEVIDFNRKVSAGLEKELEASDEYDPVAEFMLIWSTPFKPNLLNTVVFLVQTAQTMSVFFVNYKGRPWMKGLLENHMLFLSLFICIGGVAMFAWELLPQVNELIHLEPFPNDEFRWKVMGLVGLSIVGTFITDRLVTAIFAPHIFGAMMEEARKTSISDVLPIFGTLFKVAGGFLVLGTGNPLIWFGSYWIYKKRKEMVEAKEEAQLEN